MSANFPFLLFCIFVSVALLSTLSLYMKQALLFAYILAGICLGEYGLGVIADIHFLEQLGDIGIIFLLFLLGVDLTPKDLIASLKDTTLLTFIFSALFIVLGFLVSYIFGYNFKESAVIGVCMIFSSTIIGLKLLPSLALHYKPIGDVVISILLLQDLLAVCVLLFMPSPGLTNILWLDSILVFLTLPLFIIFAFAARRFFLTPLLSMFEHINEYIFLVALAWCLGLSQLSAALNISPEVGAFIAGVAIAEGSIANYIAHSLKPLRDFCLVLFFFSIGARLKLNTVLSVIYPALVLVVLIIVLKPILFRRLLIWSGKPKYMAYEIGIRLGQASEFSFLITHMATENVQTAFISQKAVSLIQVVTILTFVVSSYLITSKYPTPLSTSSEMHSD